MLRSALIQFRVEPELRQRLDRLRAERHINISAWLRSLLTRELDRELGPDGDPPIPLPPPPPPTPRPPPAPVVEAPLSGWRPLHLKDGSWGAIFQGDTAALPSELTGATIVVEARNGSSWTTKIKVVLERQADRVVVTHSGRPSTP